ncbi:T-cell surface glycoprotein CD1b-3-like isoform X2 [Oxyura jamaicensis]|uniref:T-cell surface glycoprotein CD1b-3-like isoform X2 n=1 Tax=Oxyura jamaicensis TaxID=8884 RepID=UPI0015A6E92B|nr:T-cell surface glycoprotein CD1b-3-like isoform X2 [Oxyura jamaicensis]
MQPRCLLLFPFLFFPGTWAEPEGSPMLQLRHFVTFQNATSMQVGGLGLVGDINIGCVDRRTWDIHYHQPWLRPALPKGDWDVIESSIKSYLRDFNSLVQTLITHTSMSFPFVFQSSIGCKLQPNGTTRTYLVIGYEGQDLLRFHLIKGTWDRVPDNEVSAAAEHFLNNATTLNELIQVLLNVTCVDILERFTEYGRADLERQEPPTATVFARTAGPAQLLLVCRITGFYPRPISVAWLRDGHEVPPGPALNTSAVLPNADLTYQVYSVLTVAPRDGHSYACRVRHRSLGTRSLLVPWGKSNAGLIAGLGVALLAAVVVSGALWVWRRRKCH